ncbi:hypothetical protein CEK26_000348 [Fusarium fujikuroi]|nr:uncharacterized protein LW93_11515 [Fusarium fujikuroi]KLP12731.1 uncharacterized protein LW94_6584 [Fusarium fujikuroi]QGI58220.1 hypothetical protein CEK27_000345 [Fusarium fujikuroi]QGI75438.1 hypothetical protein CEK25_000344 [Fusarium fujikuroi]QGI89133.1 hypothetical protein CEK26_000348 [Fusarium fujikuroi]
MMDSYQLCCHGAGMPPDTYPRVSEASQPHMEIVPINEAIPHSMPRFATEKVDNKLTFLSLPLEIRLNIYHWLHLMCPVRHAQLAPWYPTPVHCQYILQTVDTDTATKEDKTNRDESKDLGLLSPYRPLSGLPTSLLRTNRQIYGEARLLPFTQNEFVFVNWFASGLWAARAFTRALAPWQRGSLRYVRLEVLARDVVVGGAGREEWRALCTEWASGVRGLRMKMVLGASTSVVTGPAFGGGVGRRAEAARRWVGEGLALMERLERVEMEVVAREMSDVDKLEWCETLQTELREAGLGRIVVVCTEKVQEKMEWIKSDVGWRNPETEVGAVTTAMANNLIAERATRSHA